MDWHAWAIVYLLVGVVVSAGYVKGHVVEGLGALVSVLLWWLIVPVDWWHTRRGG